LGAQTLEARPWLFPKGASPKPRNPASVDPARYFIMPGIVRRYTVTGSNGIWPPVACDETMYEGWSPAEAELRPMGSTTAVSLRIHQLEGGLRVSSLPIKCRRDQVYSDTW